MGVEHGPLHMLDKCSATEPHPQPLAEFLKVVLNRANLEEMKLGRKDWPR